jgi:hypothetical protein
MNTTTIGVFTNRTSAEEAIAALKAAGVDSDEISYIYRGEDGKIEDGEAGERIGEGAAAGATTGAAIGALAGLVVATGILPGLGALFVAGPLATALGLTGAAATTVAGAATGAAAGGLLGALTNLGVDKEDAALYENFVRSGDTLVLVRSDVAGAAAILTDSGATEVREYATA